MLLLSEVPSTVYIYFHARFRVWSRLHCTKWSFVNVARYSHQIDTTKPLSLVVRKDSDGGEQYRLYYFLVEILQQNYQRRDLL